MSFLGDCSYAFEQVNGRVFLKERIGFTFSNMEVYINIVCDIDGSTGELNRTKSKFEPNQKISV